MRGRAMRRAGLIGACLLLAASRAFAQAPGQPPGPGLSPQGASAASPSRPAPSVRRRNARSITADNRVYLENTGDLKLDENDVATLTGDVRVRYRAYIIASDEATIDPHAGIAVFSGHVALDSSATGFHMRADDPASSMEVNLRRGTYRLTGAEHGVVPPQDLSGIGLLLPIYFDGRDMDGAPDIIDVRDSDFTTCDFLPPHYDMLARSVKIRPGKRLVARHVSIYRKGRRLITFPLIVLPLSDRYAPENYIPQIGEDAQEGYFAKFAIPYALTGEQLGLAHLDYMSLKGIGYGVDQDYSPPFSAPGSAGNNGKFSIYFLHDRSMGDNYTTGTIDQKQTVMDGFQATLDASFQNNAYQVSTASSSAFNGKLDLSRSTKASATDYSINYQTSNYGYGPVTNITQSLSQRWSAFHNGMTRIQLGLSDSTTSSSSSSTDLSTLTTQTTLMTRTGGYQWQLEVDKNALLANSLGGSGYLTGVEKLPELSVTTDPTNVRQKSLVLHLMPFLTAAGATFGDYNDQSANAKTERADFALNMDNKVQQFRALRTAYSADFEQDFYGDDAARYVLTGNYSEDYHMARQSHLLLTYGYERQYGYTPFIFDQAPNLNNASGTLALDQNKAIGLDLVTGFDFTRATEVDGIPAAPWQNLSAQLILRPNGVVSDAASPVWDLNDGQLVSLNDDIQLKTKWGFDYESNIVYDPTQHIISSVTGDLTLPIVTDKREQAGYSVRFLDGYNGYTHALAYYGADLTRSWHDYELSAVIENNLNNVSNGTTFYLVFRLKAFPAYEPFGVAKFGQGVATGPGTVF